MDGKQFFLVISEFLSQLKLMPVFLLQITNELVARVFLLVLFQLLTDLSPLLPLDVVELYAETLAQSLLMLLLTNLHYLYRQALKRRDNLPAIIALRLSLV
jgi:hypothetical protein